MHNETLPFPVKCVRKHALSISYLCTYGWLSSGWLRCYYIYKESDDQVWDDVWRVNCLDEYKVRYQWMIWYLHRRFESFLLSTRRRCVIALRTYGNCIKYLHKDIQQFSLVMWHWTLKKIVYQDGCFKGRVLGKIRKRYIHIIQLNNILCHWQFSTKN